jgi:hypothetical protein
VSWLRRSAGDDRYPERPPPAPRFSAEELQIVTAVGLSLPPEKRTAFLLRVTGHYRAGNDINAAITRALSGLQQRLTDDDMTEADTAGRKPETE